MYSNKRTVAAIQAVLIFPAVLFMVALLMRYLQLAQNEPARSAQLIVMWYADRIWTLWVLLAGLPLAVLVIGCVTLLRNGITETKPQQAAPQPSAAIRLHFATFIIAATTLAAGVILVVVGVHVLMN